MAIHMPRNAAATEPPRPAADDPPLAHFVNGTATANEATAIDESTINNLKKEEIIFIRKAPPPSDGFLIYRLVEASPDEDPKPTSPFTLSILSTSHLPDSSSFSDLLIPDTIPSHLQSQIDVIVSTRSGTGQAPCFYEGVLRPLLEGLGLDEAAETEGSFAAAPPDGYRNRYRVVTTTSPRSVTEYAVALDARERTVILLSGDGGVVDLLNGLDRKGGGVPPTIALLPLGTGNALFHSLHKPHYTTTPSPSPLTLALRTLVKGTANPLPTFRAEFSPGARLVVSSTEEGSEGEPVRHLVGAIVASYGFHAQLVWESDTPAYRVHGDKRFGMAAGELLRGGKVYEAGLGVRRRGEAGVQLLGGGREDQSPSPGFTYILATLVSNLERTFTISPASRPLDGRLRVVHFGDVGGGERTMEIMMAAYRGGEHIGMEGVGYEGGEGDDEVEEVRVDVRETDARWRKVCVDGTIVEVEEGGWFVVRREKEGGRVRVLGH